MIKSFKILVFDNYWVLREMTITMETVPTFQVLITKLKIDDNKFHDIIYVDALVREVIRDIRESGLEGWSLPWKHYLLL